MDFTTVMLAPTNKSKSGFTIVELLIVIVVIGILAAITIVSFNGIQQRAAIAQLKTDMKNSSTQLGIDNANTGAYPTSSSAANDGKGLPTSSDTVYQYTLAGNVYCLSGTSTKAGSYAFHISSSDNTIAPGVCPGHIPPGGAPPLICPSGFIVVPGSPMYSTNDFCVMKYEAKQASATVPISQATALPWTNINQSDAALYSANVIGCTGCHLITEAEWLTIAQNVINVNSNWSSGTVGTGYLFTGHCDGVPGTALAADSNDANNYTGTGNNSSDTSVTFGKIGLSQRRTYSLSNGEVIWDLSGNVSEWTSGQINGGLPGNTSDASFRWHDYTATTLGVQMGTVNPNVYPSFATPAAGAWNYTQGIGRLFSNANDNSGIIKAFFRGDNYAAGVGAGPYGLVLQYGPNSSGSAYGFRVAR